MSLPRSLETGAESFYSTVSNERDTLGGFRTELLLLAAALLQRRSQSKRLKLLTIIPCPSRSGQSYSIIKIILQRERLSQKSDRKSKNMISGNLAQERQLTGRILCRESSLYDYAWVGRKVVRATSK